MLNVLTASLSSMPHLQPQFKKKKSGKRGNSWLHIKRNDSKKGLTLIELLVAITLLATMAVIFMFTFTSQLSRSRDSRRKSDLERIKVAFEDYYNDQNCYPPAGALDNCQAATLRPYLDKIPCDTYRNNQPYVYIPEVENGCARRYRVLTHLENTDDSSSITAGCATSCGCGVAGYDEFNFGISSGVSVVGDTSSCTVLSTNPSAQPSSNPNSNGGAGASSSPTPSSSPGNSNPIYVYACDSSGQYCNQYEEGSVYLLNCPQTFPNQTLCQQNCVPNSPFRCST